MEKITILEFCNNPNNRIKLMQEIIYSLENNRNKFICCAINKYDYLNLFKIDVFNFYCVSQKKLETDFYVYLGYILPELNKYRQIKDDNGFWFNKYTGTDDRIEALTNAINDIKQTVKNN